MTHNKNENSLSGSNPAQTAPAGATSGNELKATDIIYLFPDEKIKFSLMISGISKENPLYHFCGLFEVVKNYISCHKEIDECIRENFDILIRSMEFYLNLIKVAHDRDM